MSKRHSLLSRIKKRKWGNELIETNKNCFYCDTPFNDFNEYDRMTGDHIIPKCRGGKIVEHNIVLACNMCNAVKDNTDFIKFYMFAQLYIKHNRMNSISKLNHEYRRIRNG
jgi:hypothetical protein